MSVSNRARDSRFADMARLGTACISLDTQSHRVAAAEAERSDATFEVAPLKFKQQRNENARAARSDRMAKRHCAAVHVHFLGIEPQLPRHSNGGNRKGFV